MTCVMCKHGNTKPGETTVTLQRGGSVVICKGVPAEVCENCGEHYLTQEITRNLLERADAAVKNGAEVEIIRFAA